MTDLLVVGNGLGGYLSAVSAKRAAPSARVTVLVTDEGRFDHHSGLVDVLGYLTGVTAAGDGCVGDSRVAEEHSGSGDSPPTESPRKSVAESVKRPIDAIPSLPETHPYRRLGVDTVSAALDLFDDILPTYRGGHTERNALVITFSGRLTPAARYPATVGPGLASRRLPVRLVGFEQIPDLDGALASDRLDGALPYEVAGSAIEFPGTIRTYPPAPQVAAAFDDDTVPEATTDEEPSFLEAMELPSDRTDSPGEFTPQFDADVGDADEQDAQPLIDSLVARIRPELDVEPRVGLPAVLGEETTASVVAELEDRLDATVFEVPVGSPSIPGRRLESALHDALDAAGIEVVSATDGPTVETAVGRIERVRLSDRTIEPSSVILGTGGVAAGGLVADRTTISEPVFDCHVTHPAHRGDWTAPTLLDAQPFDRVGLPVDDALRPVDDEGTVEYDNLRAVGTLLGGVATATEQSADGIAIATGYEAGRLAVGDDR